MSDTQNAPIWAEIRNDHSEETDDGFIVTSIDAWLTVSDNEEGRVIAEVIGIHNSGRTCIYVSYHDPRARIDAGAQEMIEQAISDITDEFNTHSN